MPTSMSARTFFGVVSALARAEAEAHGKSATNFSGGDPIVHRCVRIAEVAESVVSRCPSSAMIPEAEFQAFARQINNSRLLFYAEGRTKLIEAILLEVAPPLAKAAE
ncbi:hypothetical protein A2704_00605 [Candidatus Kaiserbacteria bacterium RIFCSPHIGHO2_01_FULL_54_36b]|uniref:Uncharacterized protein n=1 Tax=Candidatus Kaiserbacteria bacterium RIFCSPHIGHO2_01_FULL_54_36b TaxID=1798483 RepID=A0A1F6CS24_9BACT|nr:MAG: hypothetical protein A2704_00605 [Candidatus Kaiserbacteria bacterium RIFCSPHIGHO2_01_FULL_54_36b]